MLLYINALLHIPTAGSPPYPAIINHQTRDAIEQGIQYGHPAGLWPTVVQQYYCLVCQASTSI